jgi:nitrite reductase/ring-hydroxylating ferredoxin subunit
MTSRIELCNCEEVPEGSALRVENGLLTLAVFNVEGEFYVTDDACTHGPGSLSEGYIEGDVVECNFHHGQFNIGPVRWCHRPAWCRSKPIRRGKTARS